MMLNDQHRSFNITSRFRVGIDIMKTFLKPHMALSALALCLGGHSVYSQESPIEELNANTIDQAHRVIVTAACVDSDFRRLINVSAAECETVSRSRLLECTNELAPILPQFGLRAHMKGDATHTDRVTAAGLALVYCIQARASFEPLSISQDSRSDPSNGDSAPRVRSEVDAIRSSLTQVPKGAVEKLFQISARSGYVAVWATHGTNGIIAVIKQNSLLSTVTPKDEAEWAASMAAAGVRRISIDGDVVVLILDEPQEFQGKQVLSKISNILIPELEACEPDTVAEKGVEGACRIASTEYADFFITWTAQD